MIERKELFEPTFFQRVLKFYPKKNAFIELNNHLFENGIENTKVEDVFEIETKYKVNISKKFKPEILSLYRSYLEFFLIDKQLSDQQIDNLKHLKILLNINDNEIKKITNEVSEKVYRLEIEEAIQDGKIDEEERVFLDKIKSQLNLSEEVASKIYNESATALIQNFMNNALSDQRLSPDEESELYSLSNNLNIKLDFDDSTKSTLDKYKLYWQIENGNLPQIDVNINLQKKEYCHFVSDVQWLEQRKVTTRYNYTGPTMRIKIVKGVYWRAGSMALKPVSHDELKVIDSGKLFLTNTRLIFMGNKGSKTIKINKILDFTPYKNGVDIQKDSGKSPFIQFEHNVDIFSMILGKVISDY